MLSPACPFPPCPIVVPAGTGTCRRRLAELCRPFSAPRASRAATPPGSRCVRLPPLLCTSYVITYYSWLDSHVCGPVQLYHTKSPRRDQALLAAASRGSPWIRRHAHAGGTTHPPAGRQVLDVAAVGGGQARWGGRGGRPRIRVGEFHLRWRRGRRRRRQQWTGAATAPAVDGTEVAPCYAWALQLFQGHNRGRNRGKAPRSVGPSPEVARGAADGARPCGGSSALASGGPRPIPLACSLWPSTVVPSSAAMAVWASCTAL